MGAVIWRIVVLGIGVWVLVSLTLGIVGVSDLNLRHIRVIWQENPEEEAIVSWTTDRREEQATIYYDEKSRGGDALSYRFKAEPQIKGQFVKSSFFWRISSHYYHGLLKNLKPDTRYYFIVRVGDTLSKEFYFKTAPRSGPIQLIFGGDSRSDQSQRQRMNLRMQASWEAYPNILALVHGGDYIHKGTVWGQWDEWLTDHHRFTTRKDGRILPIIPTRGNHETSQSYFNQVFTWPGGGDGACGRRRGPA